MEIIITFIMAFITAWFGGGVEPDLAVDSLPLVDATVVQVIDGDTIVVEIQGQQETVRYIGIDTPEPYRDGEPACYAPEATAKNSELVAGSQVKLVADQEDRDTYGRLLRYVYVDEVFVNERLVAEGYATTLQIKPNTAQAELFKQAQAQAREQGVGLWSVCYGENVQVPEVASKVSDPATAVTVDTTSLPTGQQQLLNTLGVEGSDVTIAPEVIACAEEAIGVDRVAQIVSGDTPGMFEVVQLANCYRTN